MVALLVTGEAMQVDGQGLSEALIARVEDTQERYLRRAVPSMKCFCC